MSNQQTAGTAIVKSDVPPPLVPDRPPTAFLASSEVLEQITAIAAMAVKAGTDMLPASIKTPAQAAAIMLAGYELGLRPWTALRHVYIVNGKTEVETRATVGIIRARDPRIRFDWPEYTSEAVTCVLTRPGQQPIRVRYTMQDALASGQARKKKRWVGEGKDRRQVEVNGPWQLYPRDMLYAAATKRACRLGAPDLINAIEGRAIAADVVDAEFSVRDVTGDDPPPSEDPHYNAGDAPGSPLPAEVADATDTEADWRSLGDVVDEEARGDDAQASAPPAADAPTPQQARAMWASIVSGYAAQNVARLREKFEVAGKTTDAGNIAWSRYTADELASAIEAMRAFVADGAGGVAE